MFVLLNLNGWKRPRTNILHIYLLLLILIWRSGAAKWICQWKLLLSQQQQQQQKEPRIEPAFQYIILWATQLCCRSPIMYSVFIMSYDGTTELCFDSKIIQVEKIRKKKNLLRSQNAVGKCYKCISYNLEDISSDQMHCVLWIDRKSNSWIVFLSLCCQSQTANA